MTYPTQAEIRAVLERCAYWAERYGKAHGWEPAIMQAEKARDLLARLDAPEPGGKLLLRIINLADEAVASGELLAGLDAIRALAAAPQPEAEPQCCGAWKNDSEGKCQQCPDRAPAPPDADVERAWAEYPKDYIEEHRKPFMAGYRAAIAALRPTPPDADAQVERAYKEWVSSRWPAWDHDRPSFKAGYYAAIAALGQRSERESRLWNALANIADDGLTGTEAAAVARHAIAGEPG